jgi:hypothetical protein
LSARPEAATPNGRTSNGTPAVASKPAATARKAAADAEGCSRPSLIPSPSKTAPAAHAAHAEAREARDAREAREAREAAAEQVALEEALLKRKEAADALAVELGRREAVLAEQEAVLASREALQLRQMRTAISRRTSMDDLSQHLAQLDTLIAEAREREAGGVEDVEGGEGGEGEGGVA